MIVNRNELDSFVWKSTSNMLTSHYKVIKLVEAFLNRLLEIEMYTHEDNYEDWVFSPKYLYQLDHNLSVHLLWSLGHRVYRQEI